MKLLTDDVLLGSSVDVSAIGPLNQEIKGDSILSYVSDTRSASQLGASSSFISTFDGLSGQVGTIDPSAKFTQIASTFSFSDIAVAKDGTIFGITPTQLFKIDPVSGLTSFVGGLPAGVNINALEFANDVLYGAGDSNLYAINTTNAGVYLVANLESGFNSSGDLAFDAPNNRFLATSKGLTSDSLYAVPLTGEAAKIGDIGFSNILGLMFEGEKLFGFTADGSRIAINPGTGAGVFDTLVKGISDRIGGASGIQIKKGEVLSSTPGTILSADTIDVFLPPGGEITLEITVTVPGDGSEPIRSVRSIENGDRSASATTNQLPLDVFLLQDLSGSFDDDLPVLKRLVPNFLDELRKIQPDTKFGVGSFIDKPVRPFGDPNNAYVYQLEQPLTNDKEVVRSTVNNLTTSTGGDLSEGQLEALLQVARRTIQTNPIGFRDNARRVVVVSTDDTYHKAGDGVDAKPRPITKPNNGDSVVDPDEDYPSIAQAKQALSDANIFPVFTIAKNNVGSNNKPFYQDLVDNKLGFGKVVELESDSSNLVQAITDGLVQANSQIPLDKSSDDFGYVKDISPQKYENAKPGDKLKFSIKLQNDGKGGDDTLLLRIPGLFGNEEIKINVKTSSSNIQTTPVKEPLPNIVTANFVDSDTDKKLKDGISIISTALAAGSIGVAEFSKAFGIGPQIAAAGVVVGAGYINGRLNEGSTLLPYGQFPNDLGIKQNQREVSLKRFPSSLTSTPINSTEPKKTWVIIHGWNDNPDDDPKNNGDFSDIANALTTKTNDNVFLLDWRQAAAGGKVDKNDNIPIISDINSLLRLGNYTAAKWIRPVAEFAVKKLKEFGIDAKYASENLNLVGHSLGSLLSNEIARIYKNGFTDKDGETQGNGIGVNSILALDPPSQTNLSFFSTGIGGVGYDIDGRTPEADFVDPVQGRYLPKFTEVSHFSRAFVGSKSLAGNQLFAEQAKESFQMDFGGLPADAGTEHFLVVKAFKQIIDQKDGLGEIGKLFNPTPIKQLLNPSPNFKENGYTNAIGGKHDGSIAVEPPKDNNLPQPKALIFTNTSGDKDDIVYGTAGKDKLDGSDQGLNFFGDARYSAAGNDIFYANSGDDEIFGGTGNDTLYGERDKDFIKGEEDNDFIDGGDGNDSLEGNDGQDTITGGENDDTLWGGGDSSTDSLVGGKGNDSLLGEGGDDTLIGGKGKDNLAGGFGSDIFVFSPGDGAASRDEADIITDWTGGADRIGLAGGLNSNMVEVVDEGGFGPFGGQTVLKANGEFLAIIINGKFTKSDLNFLDNFKIV
jgi:Ca2+-binding RTX toxin-like protein